MVGKIAPFFPMIGKNVHGFSNDWKKSFQWLENFSLAGEPGVRAFPAGSSGLTENGAVGHDGMEQKPKDASMKKHMGRLVVCPELQPVTGGWEGRGAYRPGRRRAAERPSSCTGRLPVLPAFLGAGENCVASAWSSRWWGELSERAVPTAWAARTECSPHQGPMPWHFREGWGGGGALGGALEIKLSWGGDAGKCEKKSMFFLLANMRGTGRGREGWGAPGRGGVTCRGGGAFSCRGRGRGGARGVSWRWRSGLWGAFWRRGDWVGGCRGRGSRHA